MYVRPPIVALVVVLSGLAGCGSGGASVGQASFTCVGGKVNAICLQNCNLGCSSTGCQRTNIAQNEIIVLQFSEKIDPATVSSSSIRFRTASGDQPVGELFVNGNQVEFVPTLSISGGQTFFGFAAGETYTMTIPGGNEQAAVVRSVSGKPFEKTLTCTLQSTLGIVDLNGVPPIASLVSPSISQLGSSPRDIDLVVEFNELIDATPFLSGTASPVVFSVRRTRQTLDPNDGDARECDPASQPVTLNGSLRLDFDPARSVSVLTFRPSGVLPGNVCVQVTVTNGVQDLSGRPAQTQVFEFLTEIVPQTQQSIVEEFDDDTNLDVDASASSWSGGIATFARIGGDGRHGPFDTSLGVDNGPVDGKRQFTINTNNTIIPQQNTFSGAPVAVTDGRFFFTKMVVPADVRLRFVGTSPPVITVAGRLDILGEIDVSGVSVGTPPFGTTGQPGGAGGVFAGAGGQGGDRCGGFGILPGSRYNGDDGQSARVLGGHGYASTVATSGGRGSSLFPASGLSSDLVYPSPLPPLAYSPSAAAGGGGGGLFVAGGPGRVVSNNHPDPGLTNVAITSAGVDTVQVAAAGWRVNRYVGRTITITTGPGAGQTRTITANTADTITVGAAWTTVPATGLFTVPLGPTPNLDAMGPVAAGGSPVQLFPFPPPTGSSRSSLHFLVGGAGGGGAGSHACLALHLVRTWSIGGGGGGGGGAIALRAGNSLRIAPSGRVLASGGSTTGSSGISTSAQPGPGGAGSGGSVVMQSGNQVEVAGVVDVRGGTAGTYNRFANGSPNVVPNSAIVVIEGGAGSQGFVRLEAPGTPAPSLLASMLPAPATAQNVAPLTERDDVVSFRSEFYSTGLLFGPDYQRYEIRATVDGVPVVFSDDPAVSNLPAQQGAALRVLFQAATIDPVTGVPSETREWRTSVRSFGSQTGIASDGLTAFRFVLVMDQAVAQTVTVDRIAVFYLTST